jgi:hypothetical protein
MDAARRSRRVVFDEHGYKTLSVPAVRENSVLTAVGSRPPTTGIGRR